MRQQWKAHQIDHSLTQSNMNEIVDTHIKYTCVTTRDFNTNLNTMCAY